MVLQIDTTGALEQVWGREGHARGKEHVHLVLTHLSGRCLRIFLGASWGWGLRLGGDMGMCGLVT